MITSLETDLPCHELMGLHVKILHSSNPSHIGIAGKVVDETMKTLMIDGPAGKKHVQKKGVTYGFTLPNGTFLEIEGNQLVGRPVDRIVKKRGRT